MIRVKAATTHFILSVVIFIVVFILLIFSWYPAPHFSASGGWQGLKIAAGVDLVLGPLLTLIIFDLTKGKKKLLIDLVVIATIQLTALVWGINTIYQHRPLAIVFWENSFYSVPAAALENQDVAILESRLSQLPPLIYAEKPTSISGLKSMANTAASEKIAPHHQVNLYRPLTEHFSKIKPYQVDINEIINTNSEMNVDLGAILDENNKKIEDYLYFALHSKYYNIILLFNNDGWLQDYITVPLREE